LNAVEQQEILIPQYILGDENLLLSSSVAIPVMGVGVVVTSSAGTRFDECVVQV
jgi:hypothetical protein